MMNRADKTAGRTGRIRRAAAGGAVLVAAAVLLTGCGGQNTATPQTVSGTAAPVGSDQTATATSGSDSTNAVAAQSGSSASSTGVSGSEGTPSAASGSSVPACATSRLKITAANFDSGAGHTNFQLVFQNTGTAPCALTGFPGVSFVKIHNTQLGKAASRTSGTTSIVTLAPDAQGYADVQTINGQAGYSATQCDLTTVPTLRVYPPNQTESANIPWNKQECVGSTVQNLQVGPVHSNR
ncbi:DUF4232 domain-containing protein [Streptomyces sp.]|jgi:hypothetical protein